jgi:membrane protein implicated in regulation of membrane protease activity
MALIEYFAGFGLWNWVFLGLALCALEALIPGVHFLWFGLSALVTAALAYLLLLGGIDFDWPLQLVLFACLSFASVFLVRHYAPPDGRSDEPELNLRGAQLIGRTVVVTDAIAGGRGRVRVGDTLWPARGPDLPVGANARVTGANDTVLIIEPV